MVNALCKELILRKDEAINSELQTVYLGGGTPSILSYDELQQLFHTIFTYYKVSPSAEITLEANPNDFFRDSSPQQMLEQLRSLGINRLSLGVQSFFEEDLQLMNRVHSVAQVETLLQITPQYFDNITIDLIYGIPRMSKERWQENINKALSFDIPHISAYVAALTIFGIMLANAKGTNPQFIDEFVQELAILPSEIQKVLDKQGAEIPSIARAYADYNHALYIGRDTLYPIAMEGALKLKEVSYIHAEAYAAGELKHGPIALIDDRFFEVCYLQDNWLYEKSQSNLIEMNTRGAHAIVITDTTKKVPGETVIRVSTKLTHLTPLLFNVVSQLLAYHVAVRRGHDVDQPRNLAKSVTVE